MNNAFRFGLSREVTQGAELPCPLPLQIVSNEEYPPLPSTAQQRHVQHLIIDAAERLSRSQRISRRDFLKTSGGMALCFLAMNQVFGRFFDVLDVEAAEPGAASERTGSPFFIFDVQTHYVSRGFDPVNTESKRKGAVTKEALLSLRRRARDMGVNAKLASDQGTIKDLDWVNFVKEVFLDSDTAVGLISTPPGPYPQDAVVPPKEMAHIRDEINRVTDSQRMLAHGLVTPQLGKTDLEFMERQAKELKIDAWKCYTGSPPKGFDHGWWMDDEKVAYPAWEKARSLKIPLVCVHKGLPLGPVADYNHPRDLIKVAKDFPELKLLVYHSGFRSAAGIEDQFRRTGEIPWTTEFCRMKRAEPGVKNIYMEIGSTFAQLVTTHPEICAHVLGQILEAFGQDHLLWGTDSIWWGTPQWQIEAFRRFEIPEALQEKHRYPKLTRELKANVFGLNAAPLFGIDVNAKRNPVPPDYVSRIKMAYVEEGPEPSHRVYGWVAS